MGDAEITEMAASVQQVVGTSAYLHGIDYSIEKFRQELRTAISHSKSQAAPARR